MYFLNVNIKVSRYDEVAKAFAKDLFINGFNHYATVKQENPHPCDFYLKNSERTPFNSGQLELEIERKTPQFFHPQQSFVSSRFFQIRGFINNGF